MDRLGHGMQASGTATARAAVVRAATGLLLVVVAGGASAQAELYKCTDGNATTYSSTACEKLGLKSAGAIRDRLTVINAGQPAARQDAPKVQSPPAGDADEQRTGKAAAAIRPVNPLIDKLLK